MAEDMGKPLDWDDSEVSDEGGFTPLDEGVYPFEVAKVEKERFEGSAKMAACPRAAVHLNVMGPSGWVTLVDRLLLSTKTAWRIARFFTGLGYKKNPETGKVPVRWNEAEGKQGWVKVKVREYEYNGEKRKANDVEEYLPPEKWAEAEAEWSAKASAQAAQAAQPVQTAMPVPEQPAFQPPRPGSAWSM